MAFLMAQREPCPYCENFAGRYSEVAGAPPVLEEDGLALAYVNVASMGGMEGHTLVITRRHVETILDLTDDEHVALSRMVGRVSRAITKALEPDGLLVVQRNGLAAEQTVNHVHFHVIPRRANTPWPPTGWIHPTPYDERQRVAALVRDCL